LKKYFSKKKSKFFVHIFIPSDLLLCLTGPIIMEKLSKYLEDQRFIQWVFYSNKELEKWWKEIEVDNSKEKHNIKLARKILKKLHTSDKQLSEEEKIIIFSKILKDIEEKKYDSNIKILYLNFIRYAAVAVLFFSIGALLFYKKDNFNPYFSTQNLDEPLYQTDAKLIRPDGESILLEDDKSVIEYSDDGKVKVNDNVISDSTPKRKGKTELNQLIIPYGKTSEIILPDGTTVYLNAGSRLVYPEYFNDKNREVLLVGEAFFEVKEDKDHPFIVQTTELRIKVLGTKFNVSAYPTDNVIETVLTEGTVQLQQNNSKLFSDDIELIPGQLAAFNKTTRQTALKTVNTENYTIWKDGLCKFEGTDLSRIIKKMERFYNIRFQYSDPFLGTIKITGKLELNEDREEIINRIAVAASVKINKIGEYLYEIKN